MNIKHIVFYFLSSVLCISIVPVICAEEPLLMHIDDIRAGMQGIGKTVFSGTTIEEFNVEVVGVLKDYRGPNADAIMAKVWGGPLPLEKSGVLAGMSGSPIYIDGKLIGALAFATILPKEPMIAGITPIHEMLRDANRPHAVTGTPSSTSAFIPAEVNLSSHPQPFKMVPIQTPLTVSGVDQRVLTFMEEQLTPLQLVPVQGGNTSPGIVKDADTELKPGSAVGVLLIRGDMNISAAGTVTYRDGDKILAFGHDMFQSGDVTFPMTAEYINLTISNYFSSYKVASPIETVGTITRDWRTGISGEIGQLSHMIPLDVTIRSERERVETMRYTFEVADHPQFTSRFMKIASLNALFSTEKTMGDTTIQTRLTIHLKDAPPLIFEDLLSGSSGPFRALLSAFTPLDVLANNPFEPISPEQVSLEISLKNTIQQAEVVGLRVRDNIVSPGEQVEATITLRPYAQERSTLTETISIPEDTQQGMLQLMACEANFSTMFDAMRANAKYRAQSLSHLIQLLRERIGNNMLILSLFQPKLGVVVQGQELPSPPVSMMTILGTTRRSASQNNLTRGRMLVRKPVATQYALSGCSVIELTVNHHTTGSRMYGKRTDNFQQGD